MDLEKETERILLEIRAERMRRRVAQGVVHRTPDCWVARLNRACDDADEVKLWFVIRSYGVEGIQAMVREHLRLARLFEALVRSQPGFEVLAPVNLSLVCFRWNDGRRSEEELAALNQKLLDKVNASGRVYLTHTSLRGKYTIRLVVGQRTTEERHVRLAWELLTREAEKLTA